ncbi:21585_t:CDS:2 [Dentiscutata erythropus]|uniref:21585_t:CDS:1 n=1 Tax=Dentiscutata erythropus TaxID=1348616 RepID=A0A9N9F4T7_9GLOM|nr:21585_t:CDS:2 [Dentiscutata erythropus]
MFTNPTPQNVSCLKNLALNILKNGSRNIIAKGVEVPELDPCSSCLEDYVKDLLQCPKCAMEIEFSLVNTAILMETSPLVSSQSQNTISSEAHHVSNSSFSDLPLFATHKEQIQKRPSEDTTKNKSFSKKPKQNKEKGDKKDSNTVRKLIVELSYNNTEQTTSDTNNSYPITATETDPQSIDFLNLYTKITSAESEIQKPNQNIIIQYYNFGLGIAKRFKFYYEKSYNINDANSEVKKEIEKQLSDSTSETTIRKRKERAQKIFIYLVR